MFQALRKAVLVFGQTGTDGAMKTVEAKRLHFVHGFLGGPILFCHAIGGNGHSGSVRTQPAVHEHFFTWISSDQLEKLDEIL